MHKSQKKINLLFSFHLFYLIKFNLILTLTRTKINTYLHKLCFKYVYEFLWNAFDKELETRKSLV